MKGINLKAVPAQQNNPRSDFDLSYKKAFDFKFGDLVPVMCQPVMPDDDIYVSYEFLTRFAPFVSQVYQDYKVKFDFYFVPNRLVWRNFENFMSAGYDGKTQYVHPYFNAYSLQSKINMSGTSNWYHSILDYMDIPHNVFMIDQANSPDINALPFAAYIQCFLDYKLGTGTSLNKLYQNILSQEQICVDGNNRDSLWTLYMRLFRNDPDAVWPETPRIGNAATVFGLLKELYPLDYFTSCRPDPQLGPVMTIPVQLVNTDSTGNETFKVLNDATNTQTTNMSGGNGLYIKTTAGTKDMRMYINNPSSNGVVVNGSVFNNVASINDFYSAARIQELLTLYNYTGFTPQSRLAAEFGVKNDDARMHKAEWLHSSIHDVSIGEVFSNNANNAPSSASNIDIPGVGTAVATATNADRGFHHYFKEYGHIIGMMSLIPEAYYSQGLPRMYSIKDRFDYPHYLLSQIGMAAVRQKEILCTQANQSSLNDEFAYMSQYGDYKTGVNRVCGELRGNLNYMSAGREFDGTQSVPFNDEFLQVQPEFNNLDRTFNVLSYLPHDCPLFSKVSFNIMAKRQLPYYGLPKF